MIVRQVNSDLLLISQADHAALAERIMMAWRADGFPGRPTRPQVLEATRQHDAGWLPLDVSPSVNPETGLPYDVVNVPVEVRQGAWPRAIDELAPEDPYIGALVAQHAWTVYRRFTGDAQWDPFFAEMVRRRDALLATQSVDWETFEHDYAIVGMGDRWSLVFCYGWKEPNERGGYRATLDHSGGRLEITPDPFEGAAVPLEVPARRIPARRYASDGDLRETLTTAPVVHLTGIACGKLMGSATH